MTNPISQMLEILYAQEEFNKPVTCSSCWNHPAAEGALCADCLYDQRIQVTERAVVGETNQ